jgi:hypothetical protein
MRWVAPGVALPVVLALLLLLINRFTSDSVRDKPSASQVTDPGPVTAPQSESIDLVRAVAKRDLTGADDRLASCRSPRMRCAHLPLAHIGFGGHAAAGMLIGLADGLPVGSCRELVLGTGNTLGMLSSDADEMRRGLGNRTPSGRRISALRYASIRELIDYVRGMLHGPAWAACTPPRVSPT